MALRRRRSWIAAGLATALVAGGLGLAASCGPSANGASGAAATPELARTPEVAGTPAPDGDPRASGASAAETAASGRAAPVGRPDFVGAAACTECHEREWTAWQASHHRLAMQPAGEESVLGDFGGASFEHGGVTSTFFRRDGKYLVRTDDADGRLADFEVAYTFGVFPLQQYLVAFPGGRLQALSVAWDSRPAAEGGQRWFHLYPREPMGSTDLLHWTGRYQSWNLMCAECHSTDLRKGYDAATDGYATSWSEIDVACEACHGAGRRHVEWARAARAAGGGTPGAGAPRDDGLAVHFASDWAGAWIFPEPDAKFPERQTPLDPSVTDVCAACHARRSTLAEGVRPGAPLEDGHRLALLTAPNYFADGQQREEVYVWGSFLQSRMHARGVTCVDCHDPHGLQTRLPGNQLCQRCHAPERFDSRAHHFHDPAGRGGQCVACHMPSRTYMVVDDRADHSLRVPRPDLSPALGAPDACTQCHTDKPPSWAAEAMDGWYGQAWRERPQWGTALAAGASGGPEALATLIALAGEAEAPAIVRATALALAEPVMAAGALPAVLPRLEDPDPLVREAALGLLEPFPAAARVAVGAPLLSDPVRGVRVEAARLLADVPEAQLSPEQRPTREAALGELLDALALNADWPAENVNRGNLELRRGRPDEALAAYRRALDLDPRFVGAYVNLADTLRRLGRDEEAEPVLRRGLELVPEAADLHHALGLLLVRRHDSEAALAELGRAAALAPGNARYAFVWAVGLHSAGRADAAVDALRVALSRSPHDPDVLGALVSILRERGAPGDAEAAREYEARLEALRPAGGGG